jgi:hypothetical protein
MKRLFIGLVALQSISAFASESKIVCEILRSPIYLDREINRVDPSSIEDKINARVELAKKEGYTKVSAPALASNSTSRRESFGENLTVCVTVSK